LGKYPWEVATWEKSFGKVPNIILSDPPYKDDNAQFTMVPLKPFLINDMEHTDIYPA